MAIVIAYLRSSLKTLKLGMSIRMGSIVPFWIRSLKSSDVPSWPKASCNTLLGAPFWLESFPRSQNRSPEARGSVPWAHCAFFRHIGPGQGGPVSRLWDIQGEIVQPTPCFVRTASEGTCPVPPRLGTTSCRPTRTALRHVFSFAIPPMYSIVVSIRRVIL